MHLILKASFVSDEIDVQEESLISRFLSSYPQCCNDRAKEHQRYSMPAWNHFFLCCIFFSTVPLFWCKFQCIAYTELVCKKQLPFGLSAVPAVNELPFFVSLDKLGLVFVVKDFYGEWEKHGENGLKRAADARRQKLRSQEPRRSLRLTPIKRLKGTGTSLWFK